MHALEDADRVDELAQCHADLRPAKVMQQAQDSFALRAQHVVPRRQDHGHCDEQQCSRAEQGRQAPAECQEPDACQSQQAAGHPADAVQRHDRGCAGGAVAAERALAEVRADYVGARGGRHDGAEKTAREIPRRHLQKGHVAVGHEARDQRAPVPHLGEAVGKHQCKRSDQQRQVDVRILVRNCIEASVARQPADDRHGDAEAQPRDNFLARESHVTGYWSTSGSCAGSATSRNRDVFSALGLAEFSD